MIQKATLNDAPAAAELALLLWPEHTAEELTEEFRDAIAKEENAVFLFREGGAAVGFAHCALRHDYVEGTETSPVGYLEGIFVRENCRRRGIARALLAACETWAKELGCAEFASDCELNNEQSIFFHEKLGFAEANRLVCFRKEL